MSLLNFTIMNWNKGKKDTIKNIERVGINKYILNVSQRDYTPNSQIGDEDVVDDNDIEYIPVVISEEPSIDSIRKSIVDLQNKYDNSSDVNSFTVNGITDWMDKNKRNSLKETLNVVQRSGRDIYTLWLNNTPLTLSIDTIRQFLDNLELYAIECYQVTSRHLAEIANLDKKDDMFTYDVSRGYPNKINIDINAE